MVRVTVPVPFLVGFVSVLVVSLDPSSWVTVVVDLREKDDGELASMERSITGSGGKWRWPVHATICIPDLRETELRLPKPLHLGSSRCGLARRRNSVVPLYHIFAVWTPRNHSSRSTLADANESRDWRIYADFAQVLIAIARPLYADDPIGV